MTDMAPIPARGAPDWAEDGADWPHRDLSRFATVGRIAWHVQEGGAEGAPWVLLIHGTGAASHSWRGLIPRLTPAWRVIAPDLPGHGFTRSPGSHPLSLGSMAADIAALCAARGAAPDLIVGHSAGAAIALRLALDGRVRPRALVLVNGALTPFRGLAGVLFPAMAKMIWLTPFAAQAAARLAAGPGTAERLIGNTGSTIDAEGLSLYARLFRRPAHVGATLGMMAQWDLGGLTRDLPRLDLPVTLAIGLRDRAVPPGETRAAARALRQARVVEFPEHGHLLHEEAPEAVAGLIAEI